MITLFGSCRISHLNYHNDLNNLISFTHSTKEVIQYINFLKGELIIPIPYNKLCFRTAICDNTYINYNDLYNKLFIESDICIIEVCSSKLYMYNDFYLHQLCLDTNYEYYKNINEIDISDIVIKKQSDEEIECDILEIQKILYPKKIIIVSHYNSKINGKYLSSRNHLINLLDNICKKYNIFFVNPTSVLSKYSQEEVMTNDLGHYTDIGFQEITEYLNNYVNMISKNIKTTFDE